MTAQRNITDRGLRYRAQKNMPEHERVCVFCGRKWETQTGPRPVLEVAHLSGNESDSSPDNLSWTCRACNVAAASSLRSAGRGRATHQFNPTKSGGAASLGEWMQAVGAITPHVDRGDRGLVSSMSVSEAVAMIRATPHSKRSEFASRLRTSRRGRGNPTWTGRKMTQAERDAAYAEEDADRAAAEKHAEWVRLQEKRALERGGRRNSSKRENLFGFGRTLSPRQTTAAHGGIAARMSSPKKAKAASLDTHRGYQIHKTPDGEFYSDIDPRSWFSTKAGAEKHIDWYLKTRGNPAKQKSEAYEAGRRALAAGAARYGTVNLTPSIAQREEWGYAWREFMAGWNAEKKRGNPSAFDKCVDSVSAKGSARDPRAVCAAAGRAKYGQAEMTRRAIAGKRKAAKRNPAGAADEVFEEFHGRPADETLHVVSTRHHHEHLAAAGELRKLVVDGIDGREHTVTGFDGAVLAFNEEKNQLFIVGGDQSINLEDFGIKTVHEIETLGDVRKIDYFTAKEHLGDEGGEAVYTHTFRTTNENGKHVTVRIARYPQLIYRVREQALEFSGGSYYIRAEGIDL